MLCAKCGLYWLNEPPKHCLCGGDMWIFPKFMLPSGGDLRLDWSALSSATFLGGFRDFQGSSPVCPEGR